MSSMSVKSRFSVPLYFALAVLLSSRMAYMNSVMIETQAIYHWVALVSGMIQCASIVLVAIPLYPVTYFRGATVGERILVSSANPAVWVGIDAYHVSEAFTCLESTYYGMNIGSILFAWNFALMGILELVCRYLSKRKGAQIRVITPLPFLPIVNFVFVIYLLSRSGGADYFNLLLDGYLVIFRS